MIDDLEIFHARNLKDDPSYAVARQLLDLGEAVMQLRHAARLTRSQLGKLLGVKAADIAVLEEETPRASAGLLEASMRLLVQRTESPRGSNVKESLRVIQQLRPGLLAA
jgi:hypothetical protein